MTSANERVNMVNVITTKHQPYVIIDYTQQVYIHSLFRFLDLLSQ